MWFSRYIFFAFLLISLSGMSQPIQSADEKYQAALDLINQKDTVASEKVLDDLLESGYRPPEVFVLRAYLHLLRNENTLALKNYDSAIRLNTNDVGSRTNRALILMEMEDYPAALRDLDVVAEIYPKDPKVAFERGYCMGLNGDHKGAIDEFGRAIELDPKFADAYASRGFSRLNILTKDGLVRPAPEECTDACADLKKAAELGNKEVQGALKTYCTQ